MFKLVVGVLALVVLAAARGALLHIHTGRLMEQRSVFLTKMRIREKGTGLFCIAELPQGKIGGAASLSNKSSDLWLAIVPRSFDYISTCEGLRSAASNMIAADFRKPSNFTLNITAEDTYLALLVYCPQSDDSTLQPQILTLSIDLFENGSHLEWPQRWLGLIHLLRFLAMLHILVRWQLPYKEDSLAYGPLFLALCELLYGGFGMLQLFYFKLVGQNFYFISDLPFFFKIGSQQIVLFLLAAISIGWRWRPDTGHLADAVAPFSICYAMARLMMQGLAAYSSETADVDSYDQTIYGNIGSWATMALVLMCFLLQLVGTRFAEQNLKQKVRRLAYVATFRALLQFCRAGVAQGWLSLILQVAQLPLTCLLISLLLTDFLTVDIAKLTRLRLRQRLQQSSQHQYTPHNLKQD